ncbi:hypothetical protein E3P91_03202 [Wallemia ichthyophaga]|nr:hypothetical protein E3P91_03202 [Wallemia ichthyophaga]
MDEDELLSTFNHLQDYNRYLSTVLDEGVVDLRAKDSAVYQIGLIVRVLPSRERELTEQSYLLDPYLDRMLSPAISALSISLSHQHSDSAKNTLSRLIYTFCKTRGYKVISRFFPHSIPDLVLVINASRSFTQTVTWEFRYVVLLWLSIAIKIPFDLGKILPGEDVAAQLQGLCTEYFFYPGKEREGAVLVLSRAFMRQDMKPYLSGFVGWCSDQLSSHEKNAFIAPSILQFFCEILKVSQGATVAELQSPIEVALSRTVDKSSLNPLLRKYHVKLTARVSNKLSTNIDRVEDTIGQLLDYLSDSDTIVRWSAAKHLSRLAGKLDEGGRRDILEAILSLYAYGTDVEDATTEAFATCDYAQVSENTWHGTTLALAECVRNGIVPPYFIPNLIPAAVASLHFDLKKGAASVGSNSRDAAAYLFWAMARSVAPQHLASIIDTVSVNLIQKALFDREVHIRRAASAAFQELVGRTNLVKYGIDVLRAVDFFVVGVRRTAFLDAAVEVCEYDFYRNSIIPFVASNVLTHWDFDMRKLSSKFMGRVCEKHVYLVDEVVNKLTPRISTNDPILLHGSLATLYQLASALPCANELHDRVFGQLKQVQLWALQTPRFSPVLEVCNNVIGAVSNTTNAPKHQDIALKIISAGMTHKSEVVRFASSNALGKVSKNCDCDRVIVKMISDFDTAEEAHQQSIPLALGHIHYSNVGVRTEALECLLRICKAKVVVECRVNAYESLSKVFSSLDDDAQKETVLHNFYNGLWDYAIDQRGDVGAWVRQSCAKGLGMCIGAHYSSRFVEMVISRLVGVSLDNIYTSRWIALDELEKILPFTTQSLATPLEHFIEDTKQMTEDVYSSNKIYENVVPLYEKCEPVRDGILMGLALAIISKNEVSVYNSRKAVLRISEELLDDVMVRCQKLAGTNTKTSFFTGLANILFNVADESAFEKEDHFKQLVTFNEKYCQKSKVISRITVGMKIATVLYYKFGYSEAHQTLRQYLLHPLPRIRATTAEEVYIQAQTYATSSDKQLEWLMDTDWLSKSITRIIASEVYL